MGNTLQIDGRKYAEMISNGAANLGIHREDVNGLNVFPIPDGDTGDNMFMTIRSGAVAAGEGSDDLGKTSDAVSGGMLPGARGNSGVILSRIFAGISKGLAGKDRVNVREFGAAMEIGISEAYGAVNNPVEGTILTVYRDAVAKANSLITDSTCFEDYFSAFVQETKESLERTPDLLEVLREAGVVDSGGAGLMYIAEGMLIALEGRKIEYSLGSRKESAGPDLSSFGEDGVLEFGYCTEFLLRLTNSKVDVSSFDEKPLFDWLYANGESVVAFRDGSIIKVHIHTFTPGDVLNHVQQFGEFLTLKIENMSLQHNENLPNGARTETSDVRLRIDSKRRYGTVAVACGDGIKEMFSSLGTDRVIDGGQSMNPCAGDFLDAFREVNAETIFVFPNNPNVILAANQAAQLYTGARVVVIPTKTVGDGYAALSMIDLDAGSAEEITESAKEAMEGVVTGFVSRAGRDSSGYGVEVKNGDFIGFCDKDVMSDSPDRIEAALELLDRLDAGSRDVNIIIRGAGVPEEESDRLCAELSKRYPSAEIIPTDGGQPVHDYIFVLE